MAKFVPTFPFQIEGTDKVETRHVEWMYSGSQDGAAARLQRAYEQLERIVRDELATRGGRVYEKPGQKIPIWGSKK